jgi:hypothetical protein
MKVSFGQSERERVEIDVPAWKRASVDDYNWLTVCIRVQAGGFQGEVSAAILTDDLVRFLAQLRPLHQTLSGSAEFSTMEDQLSLRLVGDGKGHIDLSGEVADRAGDGNRLHFRLQFDQSQLGASVRQLEQATSDFPACVV